MAVGELRLWFGFLAKGCAHAALTSSVVGLAFQVGWIYTKIIRFPIMSAYLDVQHCILNIVIFR